MSPVVAFQCGCVVASVVANSTSVDHPPTTSTLARNNLEINLSPVTMYTLALPLLTWRGVESWQEEREDCHLTLGGRSKACSNPVKLLMINRG